MERANRDIKTILRLSFGSSNFPRMRNRIMLVMNDDSAILYTSGYSRFFEPVFCLK